MRGGWRAAALLAGLFLFATACTSTSNQASDTSPSTQASPSESPSASPSTAPASPSAAPTTTPGSTLAITGLPFHNGEVGIYYLAVTLGAAGGTAPYAWAIAGGTFPPGLSLSPDGTVNGTNTTSGQFSFTVKVTDSTGATATSPSGFGVFPAMAVTQPCASQCIVGAGCAKCGGFGTVKGGLGPYTYKVVGGYVPDGMTLSGLSLKGAFPQSPLGAFNLSVQVIDQFTAAATVNASWYVYNPATLYSGGGCTNFNTGACTVAWSYSGGNANVDPVVVWAPVLCDCSDSGTLPPNFRAVAKGGTVTITAGPIACDDPGWSGEVALLLVDRSACQTTYPSNQMEVSVQISNGC